MTKKILIGLGIALVIIGFFVFLYQQSNKPGKLDTFATCIKDSGARFFGAWWCPHCQNQKARFGRSAKLLPYIECSTPDRKQIENCTTEGITGYPTWKFADGSVEKTEMELAELAEKTQCVL
ncbi:MAG TPA: hypothetical protein VLB02_01700, partial [Candidatus Paceibacterota bacterium]|nr:hypothetical protein [Candidatus Paceibacterota bacterium]